MLQNTVTIQHLERRSWSVAQCQRMFKEILEGERQLTETEHDIKNLRASLGLGLTDKAVQTPIQNSSKTRTTKKVGQRKPKRDSVGLKEDVS